MYCLHTSDVCFICLNDMVNVFSLKTLIFEMTSSLWSIHIAFGWCPLKHRQFITNTTLSTKTFNRSIQNSPWNTYTFPNSLKRSPDMRGETKFSSQQSNHFSQLDLRFHSLEILESHLHSQNDQDFHVEYFSNTIDSLLFITWSCSSSFYFHIPLHLRLHQHLLIWSLQQSDNFQRLFLGLCVYVFIASIQ